MELPSISTEPQTAQSANAPQMSSATASSQRMFVSAPPKKPFICYRQRLEMAQTAAKHGLGFEDLQATFKLVERDARKIVGL